jgi:acetamidase/formamidase
MKKILKKILYREHSSNNKITNKVDQNEWFQIETQMNRGPNSNLVDESLVDTFNKYRDDSMPDDRGNPSSGCIWVNNSKKDEVLNIEIGNIETHEIGYTKYRGSTGAFPSYIEPSVIGEVFKVVRIIDKKVIWNNKLSIPIKPMIGMVGLAPEHEARSNSWAGEWGGNFDIQEITTGATVQIPINHDGSFLHVGDMHAIQGDGEISGGGGIETGGTVIMKCNSSTKPSGMIWPRIINDEYIMTTAQARPAEDGFRIALSEMLVWLENEFNIDKKEGFMLLAQVLEARVTQFVNPTYTYLLKLNKKFL